MACDAVTNTMGFYLFFAFSVFFFFWGDRITNKAIVSFYHFRTQKSGTFGTRREMDLKIAVF